MRSCCLSISSYLGDEVDWTANLNEKKVFQKLVDDNVAMILIDSLYKKNHSWSLYIYYFAVSWWIRNNETIFLVNEGIDKVWKAYDFVYYDYLMSRLMKSGMKWKF